MVEAGANIFCPNKYCKPRVVAKIVHFACKDAMDIEGLSEKTAEQFYDVLKLRECSDLFYISAEDLKRLEGFKDRKVGNILGSIKKSKDVSLDKFLLALGIDGVGKVAAKDLAKAFKSLDGLAAASREQLLELENVGEITADGILSWFADEKNIEEISKFKALGFDPKITQNAVKSGIFTGQFVVLTGTLQTFKRSEAQKIIEEQGGECQSSVTGKTTLVIAGESAGSKLEKAKKLGIKIIDEANFKNMLD